MIIVATPKPVKNPQIQTLYQSLALRKLKSETSDDDNQSHKSSIASVASNNHNNKPTVSDKEKNHQLWLCRVKLQKTLIQRNQATTPKYYRTKTTNRR